MKFKTLSMSLLAMSFICQLSSQASDMTYGCSTPPLEATFKIVGGHYNGSVMCGNLFTQYDIPESPVVKWKHAKSGKLYTLLVVDFDGNAHGSWPDAVKPGENTPVRHWIVGNIPGAMLSGQGYTDSDRPENANITVMQNWRPPHIPVVSDRYGMYLFEQTKKIDFAKVPEPITNFDCTGFLNQYKFGDPVAKNWFVALYTSETPFSGKEFHGNAITDWHKDQGKLAD